MNELDLYTPATLTHAVNKIIPENLYLTKVLGRKAPITAPTEAVIFDVKEGRRDLAPVGHPGDPATRVDLANTFKTYTVTPPQIFLEDPIRASSVAALRMAGQSPITVGSGDASGVTAAFNEYVAEKQKNMSDAIYRRIEWMFAQVLTTGGISYTAANGRKFSIDYGVPDTNSFTASAKWDATSSAPDPILQLRQWQRTFAELNGMNPTVMICGQAAADAFRANSDTKNWMKSAGVQILQTNMGVNEDMVTPVAVIPGLGTLVEYSGKYPRDADGVSTFYIGTNDLVLTHPDLWQLHFGAIYDFDLGDNPVAMVPRYSKIKESHDGKTKSLFVESHPLPVLEINTGIMVVTVAG